MGFGVVLNTLLNPLIKTSELCVNLLHDTTAGGEGIQRGGWQGWGFGEGMAEGCSALARLGA